LVAELAGSVGHAAIGIEQGHGVVTANPKRERAFRTLAHEHCLTGGDGSIIRERKGQFVVFALGVVEGKPGEVYSFLAAAVGQLDPVFAITPVG